jgi:transposase
MSSSKVAAIDVHKKVLMVVLVCSPDEQAAGEQRRFATTSADLSHLAAWLQSSAVSDVVMESTAQYWKPVWRALEPHFRLHLAQAQSNKAPHGRKHDFGDATRLGRRFLAGELILSFVPEQLQRSWRKLTRGRVQLVHDRVRLQNQVEALLEETGIKLSSVISDLFGNSGRRILKALADGQTDPQALAALGDRRLRCTPEQLQQALSGHMGVEDRELLQLWLEHVELLDRQITKMETLTATALAEHQDAVARLTEVPGIALHTALGIVAEAGPRVATFRSAGALASWVGVCPGQNVSAGISYSESSPKGNRHLRSLLVQAAHAAVKTKGSHFQSQFRRWLPRLGFQKAIWATAHRLCRIAWKILHDGVSYTEPGQITDPRTKHHLAQKHLRALRQLGFQVSVSDPAPST